MSTDLWLSKGDGVDRNASLSHVAFLMRHMVADRGRFLPAGIPLSGCRTC